MMEKKPERFDSTRCFMVFGTWVDTIQRLERPEDKSSPAYMLFKAIAEYSMYDEEPDFSKEYADVAMLEPFWFMFADEIERSIKRRKAYFEDEGPDEEQEAIIDYHVKHPNASRRKASFDLGIDRNKIQRTVKRYGQEIEARRYNLSCADNGCGDMDSDSGIENDSDMDSDADTDSGIDSCNDIDNDIIETRQYETERDSVRQCETPQVQSWREKYQDLVRQELDSMVAYKDRIEIIGNLIYEYLLKHKEDRLQKLLGDQYGRWITGWDEEKDEPIISYPLSYLPKSMMHHRYDLIPRDRYTDDDLPW